MRLEGSKLVLIGGAGLIGSHTADRLLAEDVGEVVIYDNFVRGRHENLENALEDPRVRLHLTDGRTFVLASRERFDVIASEPVNNYPPESAHRALMRLYAQTGSRHRALRSWFIVFVHGYPSLGLGALTKVDAIRRPPSCFDTLHRQPVCRSCRRTVLWLWSTEGRGIFRPELTGNACRRMHALRRVDGQRLRNSRPGR